MTWSWNKNVLKRWVFNLENTFWTPIKHYHLSHLKALWRRFEGSISKSFKHTVQTSSGRITWGRGEDILRTGVFSILKTIYERVQKFQREQIEGVMGAFWRLTFQIVSRHLASVFISYDLKLRCRRSGDVIFQILNTLSKHLRNISVWAIWRRYENVLKAAFP